MTIHSKTIPHSHQRYDTVGDWWFDKNGDLQIRVSKMGNVYYEAAVSLHEQMEALLCQKRKITDKQVTAFDMKFEKLREPWDKNEPGDDPLAPYRNEHCLATTLERILIGSLDLSWKDYEEACNSVTI